MKRILGTTLHDIYGHPKGIISLTAVNKLDQILLSHISAKKFEDTRRESKKIHTL